MYLKIVNLLNFGNPNYKELDINKFVAGSQVYDFENSLCYLKTEEEDIPTNPDITVIDEQTYTSSVNALRNDGAKNTQSIENRIAALEIGLAQFLGV